MTQGLFTAPRRYAELQCRSYFSLLQGASSPEQLVAAAQAQGLHALALTDWFSVAGIPRFQRACAETGIKAVYGAQIRLAVGGGELALIVQNATGWRNLCRLLSIAHAGITTPESEKDWTGKVDPVLQLSDLENLHAGLFAILDARRGPDDATAQALKDIFGSRLYQALTDHLRADDGRINIAAARRAESLDIPILITGDAMHHDHATGRLRDVLLSIDQGQTMTEARLAGTLPANHQGHLRSGDAHAARFPGMAEALVQGARIADACNFTLDMRNVTPPRFVCPDNLDPHTYLEKRCWAGFAIRYELDDAEACARLTHELTVVQQAGLSEYFLHTAALCDEADRLNIKHSGRGSAAGAMVSYVLNISQLCPLQFGLSFERFINPQRTSPIDIDLDFDSSRRDEIIRYALAIHGREHAALVCVHITYSTRLAMREVGKALDLPIETTTRYAQLYDRHSPGSAAHRIDTELDEAGIAPDARHPLRLFAQLLRLIENVPRHRGQHPGGTIFTRDPLCEWMPIERAAMPGRYVVQWDKDDIDELGLPKLDLLGLRSLTLIGECERLLAPLISTSKTSIDLNELPGANYLPDARNHRYASRAGYVLKDDPVWHQLEIGDAIGLFQVQSRAQIQLIDKTKPADLMELATEIAIIRPGPIQGGLLKAYVDRKRGLAPVTYLHARLEPLLKRTLGVAVFQENLMDVAIALAGFTPADADSLRRAANRKNATVALEQWRARFMTGCLENGITDDVATQAFDTVRGFAAFGFLLSHSASFARLSYQTMWLKHHHPQYFYVGLLNSESGFYSDQTIAGDLRRHGLRMLPMDARESGWQYTPEGHSGIRIGFWRLKHFNKTAFELLATERTRAPFTSLPDLSHRVPMHRDSLYELVRSGALDYLGERRKLLWELGEIAPKSDPLPLIHRTTHAALVDLDALERLEWDVETSGLSAEGNIMKHLQPVLSAQGYLTLGEIRALPDGAHCRAAAPPYIFQRPGTANGVCFMGLEFDDGLLDLVIWPHVYEKYRSYIRTSALLKFEGTVQQNGATISVIFERPATD